MRISNWRLYVRTALAVMSLSLAVSCATQQELPQSSLPAPAVAQPAPPPSLPAAPQTGAKPSKAVRASYQGTAQAGQPTASGEPYNPNDLTAASRTLQIGSSSVVVTNPAKGSSVKVRINDRRPLCSWAESGSVQTRGRKDRYGQEGCCASEGQARRFESGDEQISRPLRGFIFIDSEFPSMSGDSRCRGEFCIYQLRY